ncbi:MAG TPA: hypothetical protein VF532_13625 [Candidatus Angelobacter sp.]
MRNAVITALIGILVLCITSPRTFAGDDASGPILYSTDLSLPFSTYALSAKDKAWSQSLVDRLQYKGRVVHFVRTSLPLKVDNSTVQGAVYQAVERPEMFYVMNSDAILELGAKWAYNPGVAGFSMHAPQSRNFIACLNLEGGVPFLSSSPVQRSKVTWKGHDYNRFKRS